MVALGRRMSGFRRPSTPVWPVIETKIDLIFRSSSPADGHHVLPDFAVTELSPSTSYIYHAPFGTHNLFPLYLHVTFDSLTLKPFRTFVVVPRTFETLLVALLRKPVRIKYVNFARIPRI